jgi:hypothetical protein
MQTIKQFCFQQIMLTKFEKKTLFVSHENTNPHKKKIKIKNTDRA